MKKTIEDYGKNLDRIKKKLPAEREELSRERIELQPKTSSRAMETSVGLGL